MMLFDTLRVSIRDDGEGSNKGVYSKLGQQAMVTCPQT